jgi:hypothetical protein
MMQKTLHFVIHELIDSIWNKEGTTITWREHIIVPVYKNGNKISYTNYREISRINFMLGSEFHPTFISQYK